MLNVIARGCPSWTPVPGWQDQGGCWSPPAPPSPWPLFLTHFAIPVLAALFVTLLVVGNLNRQSP